MSEDAFAQFVAAHDQDLRRISRHTRGEASVEDVQAEAWLMAVDLRGKGITIDLRDPEHQSLLISHLYQHLVRYTELHVRNAVRLDHAPGAEDGAVHPLAHLLAADAHYDPVVALTRAQEERHADFATSLDVHRSLASAYLYLLGRLGNDMANVADHLMISLSYCYRRCAHARSLVVHQQALPAAAMARDPTFVPGAWRRFRLQRIPVQLSFDFEPEENLFGYPD